MFDIATAEKQTSYGVKILRRLPWGGRPRLPVKRRPASSPNTESLGSSARNDFSTRKVHGRGPSPDLPASIDSFMLVPMLRRPFRFMPPLGPPKAGPKQRVLAAWRGADLAPLESAVKDSAQGMKNLMPKVLSHLRMESRQKEAEIMRVWNNLIDPVLAEHAQPAGIHKGTLFVNVDNSVWLSEIVRYRRKEILNRLQHSFGKDMIQRISFRLG